MKRNFLLATFLFLSIATSFSQTVSFTLGTLSGESLSSPTSLQFGPDGRLYVSQQNGLILIYTIVRNGPNNYQVTATETITLVQQIPNHNDDGALAATTNTRQVTGLVVAGTAANPVIYVTSSDPRIGGGGGSTNKNLDTNSGIISKLTKTNGTWTKLDLVRGLPRSEENHSPNGLEYDAVNNYLYMAQGGNTNMGAPSNNFVNLPEYAYSTAILKIDLNAIGNNTYDLPTLDDQTQTNVGGAQSGFVDPNDPFGGNDGKNQGMLVANGPVQVYSPGWRNNYDVLITQSGRMYSFDNGPNAGWGGPPSNCSNAISEPGIADCDELHYVTQGYYAGHANPTRGNRNNKFNTSNPQTPIPVGMENSIECTYSTPSNRPGAITDNCSSSNGICEYTASNFNNAMKGDLLVASFNAKIYRIELNATGTALGAGGKTTLASNFGTTPLDITAQGDNDIFPGSIWVCTYGSSDIAILEPNDFVNCSGDLNSFVFDFDADGFSNGDETTNETDPCSAASKPSDFDNDHLSDLNDPDDDNDGINDNTDRFALDPLNGFNTTLPVRYDFDNSLDGGILGWGFTGLMTNGGVDYASLYDADAMTVGGAALKFTIEQVPSGDALNNLNSQLYGYQFGLNVGASQWSYIVHSRVMGPFAGLTPVNNQSMGMFIGTGDEDNYLKIVTAANGGSGGIQVLKEESAVSASNMYGASILNKSYVDLFLYVNKNTHQVQPKYSIEGGPEIAVGSPITVPANWLSGVLAVGFISTSRSSGQVFPATWDFIEVEYDQTTVLGEWYSVASLNAPTARHECSYVQAGNKFYLLGGRGGKPVQSYDPHDSLWTTEASNPLEIHHFQAVEYNGLIYAVCALTGSFPHETPIPNIYIYDPVAKQWSVGPSIPAARRRGSAGVVVYNNKIYVTGGIQDGHSSGWVRWTDVFNPQNNTWTQLADAPIERDHFNATVVNGKIYCIGGRRTNWGGNVFNPTVAQVDVYDIASNTWSTLPANLNIPTPRAACATAVLGDEILSIGGESGTITTAHNETEAFNYVNQSWRTLTPLLQGRHATGAIVSNGGVYIVCGSGNRGGSPELGTQEVFYFFDPTPPTGTEIIKGNLVPDAIGRYYGLVKIPNSLTKSITVENAGGNQVIMIDSIAVSSEINFSIDFPHTFPFLLGVNQTTTINITFHPTSTGIKNATLKFNHNGSNNPLNIALQGEGTNQTCTSNCVNKIYYPDADADQYGYPDDSIVSALVPTGFVLNNDDCDDTNTAINPATGEILDSYDNNCNGAIDEGFGPPNVLFVVGNTILSVSDAAIKARMDQLGFEVSVISDAAVQAGDAVGKDLIFLSSTVTSGNIGNKFTNAAVPLINCEGNVFDDLQMTDDNITDFGSMTNQTQLSIINASHPLAGGLTAGTKTVFTSTDRLVYGIPSSGAAKVATVVGNSTQIVIFGYEVGANMVGMNAPARRVGLFLYDTGASKMNATAIALLDAALLWAVNSNVPPQVSITSPANGTTLTAPANISISANASSTTGNITKVELYQNNLLADTDNSSPYSFSLSNIAAGSYSYYAKAYDNLGLTNNSSAINITVQAAAGGSGQALLVVGSTTLNSGDQALKTRMETLGYTVTIKSASSSATSDANGKSVVFISSTVSSTNVTTKFKNVTVSVIVCESALLDDMDMADDAGSNYGTVNGANKISITNNSHPLAAGLPVGDVTVYSSNDNLLWGKPGSNAIVIGNIKGAVTQIALFGYESGLAMAGINAPARRVGFFLNDISASILTAQGTQLLDAALLWAAPLANTDCNGDLNGSASLNECGICVGGNTGLAASEGQDCNGDCNGTAFINSCGICVVGNTGLPANSGIDCSGQCGSAILNDCGVCVGGATGLGSDEGKDCNGDCGGTAFINTCGICVGGNTGLPDSTGFDCAGQCGNAFLNDCGICVGGSTGFGSNEGKDCHGDCGGTAFINTCGICVGGNTGLSNSTGFDCAGQCGNAFLNDCGICVGGSTGLGANEGKDCHGDCNGTAFMNTCGICVGGNTGLSDSTGFDCASECSNAFLNDCGICVGGSTGLGANEGKDCHGDCDGTAFMNTCGICVGGNTGLSDSTGFDCASECSNAFLNDCGICVGGSTGLGANEGKDCHGDCDGTAFMNTCGICVGGNTGLSDSTGFDCAGECSNAFLNDCGICVGGSTGLGANEGKDCHGDCDGTAFMNTCGICVGGNTGLSDSTGFDCAGQCGNAFLNDCGICVGGSTGLGANEGKDCHGDCNGTAFMNTCGICVGGNTGLSDSTGFDCASECSNAFLNDCGICVGGSTGLGANEGKDCHGDCNGTAFMNTCGICVGGNTGLSDSTGFDCSGQCDNAFLNDCSICVGGSTGLGANEGKDCHGDCNGTAFINTCGICVGGNTGLPDSTGFDCSGQCGNAFLNDCGICVGGSTGLPATQGKDCNGVCNGTASLNSCGICVGGNTGLGLNQGKDCNGVCGGTAAPDACGVCSGGNTGHTANSDKDVCGVCFGNGSSCAPTCVQNEVVSFTLMHSGTAGEIGPLTNGMTINLFITGSISIRANVCNQPVGSVKFILNGSTYKTETSFPYALNGDTPAGNYTKWNASVGSYTLKGTPYSGASATGTAGISKTITFTVINQSNILDCNGVSGGTAHLNSCGICVGGNTGFAENQGKDCNGVCNGTAIPDNCGVCSGGNTGHVANSDKDVCGVCFGNGSSCAPCVPLQAVSFTLMHEGTAGSIGTLTENMTINLSTIGNFSVRANICPGSTSVKSVKFALNGSTYKTENTAPFAINGDVPSGNYLKWNVSPGSYTLKVTPYSGVGGSGTVGIPFTVHFTVVQSASKTELTGTASSNTQEILNVYPNPSGGRFLVEMYVQEKHDLYIAVFNHLGQMVHADVKREFIGELKEQIHLDDEPAGMYFLQLSFDGKIFNEKIIIRR